MEMPTNDLIKSVLGEDHPIPLGWDILIQTHNMGNSFLLEDGTESIFDRPDISKDDDVFRLCIGRVLMIGDAAYTGPGFEHWKIRPQIGDHVSFRKYAGTYRTYNRSSGLIECQYIRDHDVISIEKLPKGAGYVHFVGN